MRLALAALAILALAAAVRLRADARRWAAWDALDADDSEIVGPDPRTDAWLWSFWTPEVAERIRKALADHDGGLTVPARTH